MKCIFPIQYIKCIFLIQCIKSRANILTRVQSKAYTEPSSFSSLFNLPYSKDIHYFSQARHIAPMQCMKCIFPVQFMKCIFPIQYMKCIFPI